MLCWVMREMCDQPAIACAKIANCFLHPRGVTAASQSYLRSFILLKQIVNEAKAILACLVRRVMRISRLIMIAGYVDSGLALANISGSFCYTCERFDDSTCQTHFKVSLLTMIWLGCRRDFIWKRQVFASAIAFPWKAHGALIAGETH